GAGGAGVDVGAAGAVAAFVPGADDGVGAAVGVGIGDAGDADAELAVGLGGGREEFVAQRAGTAGVDVGAAAVHGAVAGVLERGADDEVGPAVAVGVAHAGDGGAEEAVLH